MSNRCRILGVVPARGGSKGIPGKNIKLLNGQPLLAYTVAAAQASDVIDDLVVSTDSEEIASVARSLGIPVPWLRPVDLARDDSPSNAAVIHALDEWAKSHGGDPDWVVLLQPTSPFRRGHHIRTALSELVAGRADSAVGVVRVKHHPAWSFTKQEDGTLRPVLASVAVTRRQDLQEVLGLNGALYAFPPSRLRKEGKTMGDRCMPLVMSALESLDIDTMEDWSLCQAILAAGLVETDVPIIRHVGTGQPP